jgi:hypothetical protein
MQRAALDLARVAALLVLCARPTAAQLSDGSTQSGVILVRIATNASAFKIGEPIKLRVTLINKGA